MTSGGRPPDVSVVATLPELDGRATFGLQVGPVPPTALAEILAAIRRAIGPGGARPKKSARDGLAGRIDAR